MNVLPGLPYSGPEHDGFWRSDELVHYFQRYVKHFHLPVQTSTVVISVERDKGQKEFIVKTKINGQLENSVKSRSIVIASGNFLRFI